MVIPAENERDLKEMADNIKESLIHSPGRMDGRCSGIHAGTHAETQILQRTRWAGDRTCREPAKGQGAGGQTPLIGLQACSGKIPIGINAQADRSHITGTNISRQSVPRVADIEGQLVNKSELIDHIAAGSDISRAAAARALDSTIDAITDALKQSESVALVGFWNLLGTGTGGANRPQSANGRDYRDRGGEGTGIQGGQGAQGCIELVARRR